MQTDDVILSAVSPSLFGTSSLSEALGWCFFQISMADFMVIKLTFNDI